MIKLEDRYRSILISMLKWLLIIIGIYILVRIGILGYVAPFIIALLITSLLENPIRFFEKKLGLPRGLAVAIVLAMFMLLMGGMLVFIFYQVFIELFNFTKSFDVQAVISSIEELITRTENIYLNLPQDVIANIENNISNNIDSIITSIYNLINNVFGIMLSIVQSLPQVFLFIVVTLVATFFISRDRVKISEFVFKQMPKGWKDNIQSVKGDLFLALLGYIRAQIFLISVTFVITLIGFYIIGIPYAFFLAILSAFLDLLPVVGPGTIMIPGAVIYLIAGNSFMGFGFIVLYISIMVTRQILEPRIIGGGIGLHPLVTLISIYVGFRLFGIFGLIIGPLIAIVLKSLQKAKIIPGWKT